MYALKLKKKVVNDYSLALPPLRIEEGSGNTPIPEFVLGHKYSANHSLRALITTLVNPIPQQHRRGV